VTSLLGKKKKKKEEKKEEKRRSFGSCTFTLLLLFFFLQKTQKVGEVGRVNWEEKPHRRNCARRGD